MCVVLSEIFPHNFSLPLPLIGAPERGEFHWCCDVYQYSVLSPNTTSPSPEPRYYVTVSYHTFTCVLLLYPMLLFSCASCITSWLHRTAQWVNFADVFMSKEPPRISYLAHLVVLVLTQLSWRYTYGTTILPNTKSFGDMLLPCRCEPHSHIAWFSSHPVNHELLLLLLTPRACSDMLLLSTISIQWK